MVMSPSQQVFLLLLATPGMERAMRFYEEMSHYAPQADIKASLQAGAFIANKTLATLDECFRLVNAQPMKVRGAVLRRSLRTIFVVTSSNFNHPRQRHSTSWQRATHLHNLRAAEYLTLNAAADVIGHSEVGVLLESCLADHVVSVERAMRMIRDAVTERISGQLVA